jgi:zinc transporter ZupT
MFVDVNMVKIGVGSVLFVVDLIAGWIPLFFTRYFIDYHLIDYFNSFGGGILIGVSLLLMLSASEMNTQIDPSKWVGGFPTVHFISTLGFFFTFFIQWCIKSMRDCEWRKAKLKRSRSGSNRHYIGLKTIVGAEDRAHDDEKDAVKDEEEDTAIENMDIRTTLCHHPKSFLLVIILIVESILTGLTIGVQDSKSTLYILFFAVISHDWIESIILIFSFWELVQDMSYKKTMMLISFCFAVSTPLGILGGVFVSGWIPEAFIQLSSKIFLSFASGTFLYVSTIEMLARSIRTTKFSLLCFILALFGFSLSSALLYFLH